MRVLRKISAVVLMAALVTAAFAACSGTGSTQTGTQTSTQNTQTTQSSTDTATSEASDTAEEAAGEADTGPVEQKNDGPSVIKFMYWGSPAEKAAVENAIVEFEEQNPNIVVQGLNVPGGDFYTKLTAMIAGNEAPDLSYSGAWKLKLGEDGVIYDFNELAKIHPEMSQDGLVEFCEWKWSPENSAGPFQASVTPSLMYNKAIFEELGVELPPTKAENAWTWDEFVEVAKKLTLDNNGVSAAEPGFDADNIKQFGVSYARWWAGYMPQILSLGGNYLSDDGAEFGLNKPEAITAIQNIADLTLVHKVNPTPVQASSMPATATALQTKRVAMVVDGSWNHADLANTDMDWGVGVLPMMGGSYKTFFHGGSIIIFKTAKDLDATCALYNWITNPEKVLTLHQGLWLPQYQEWYTDKALIETWASESLPGRPAGFQDAVMRSTFENAELAPEQGVKNFNEIDPLVGAALDEVWSGKKTAQQAMDEVLPKVTPLLNGWYFDK